MGWLAFGGLTRELADGEIVVGSGADADWRVPTADLMPRHFVLTVHGLNCSVRPSSADVVIVVNGNQLTGTSALLGDGDVIAAGRGRFIFSDDTPRVLLADSTEATDGYLVDDRAKQAHPLINRSTTLGRDASNSIVVRDPTASRFHAEVRREAGGFALHSMGSAGTMLNGAPMAGPALLSEGDTVEIAHTKLRFTLEAPSGELRLAASHSPQNDEVGRKPTVVSNRVFSGTEGQAQPDGGGPLGSFQALVWVIAAVALAVVVWLMWR